MGFATWMPDELRRFGVRVEETTGWQRRGSSSFAPLGVVCHHTAATSRTDRPSLRLCIEGRAGLPGPLCNILLTRGGVAVLVAAGRANHAGVGGFRGVKGNSRMLGIEAENDGRGEPWPAVQLEAYERIVAGLLGGIGRDESWCIGHREWAPGRKIDPTFDMDGFRRAVASVLRGGPPVIDLDGTAAPAATAPGLLRIGSAGPAVREWQEQLNHLGASLAVDGDFGPQTDRVTREFQASEGLIVDGIVGPRTRAAMAKRRVPTG